MSRSAVAIAAAFLALVGFAAEEAQALTSKTRLCIQNARRDYRDALRTARAEQANEFQNRYNSCFGPGADCAAACTAVQDTCLNGDGGPRKTQQNCIDDRGTSPTDSCNEKFDKQLGDCQAIKDVNVALACAAQARLDRFACTQGCALAVQPAVDQCNADFGDCVQACASDR